MSAFIELRNVIRARHDQLKIDIKRCQDPAKLALLKARKTELWDLWHDFLFAGPSPYGPADKKRPVSESPLTGPLGNVDP